LTIAAEIRKFVDEFLLGYFRLFNYIHFKMKTLTFLFFGLLLCPMTLLAQSADVLLQKVADALSAGKDDYAVSLFRQAADADAGQTEMFYWTSVGKATAAAPRLAQELAVCYRDKRNYDKAYLFYKEWLQYYPEDVSALVACAEMQMMRGETKDAMKLYEKVLALDADNLQRTTIRKSYRPHVCSMPVTVTDCRIFSPMGIARLRGTCRRCFNSSRLPKRGRPWSG